MLEYDTHALDRATQRGVTHEQIEFAWNHPAGSTEQGSRPDTLKFTGTMPSGQQLVIVVAKDNRRRIITVWPDRRK